MLPSSQNSACLPQPGSGPLSSVLMSAQANVKLRDRTSTGSKMTHRSAEISKSRRGDSASFPPSQRSLCDGLGFSNSKIHLRYRILTFNPPAIPFGFKQRVYLLLASTKRQCRNGNQISLGSALRVASTFLLADIRENSSWSGLWGGWHLQRPGARSQDTRPPPLRYTQPVPHLGYSAVAKSFMKEKKRKNGIM